MKKITKENPKKRSRKCKMADQRILFLSSLMPYGKFRGTEIKKLIDDHWLYWVSVENDLRCASEVRMYVEDHYQKVLKLKERSKKL